MVTVRSNNSISLQSGNLPINQCSRPQFLCTDLACRWYWFNRVYSDKLQRNNRLGYVEFIQEFNYTCTTFITSQLNDLFTIKDSNRLHGKCTQKLFNWKQSTTHRVLLQKSPFLLLSPSSIHPRNYIYIDQHMSFRFLCEDRYGNSRA